MIIQHQPSSLSSLPSTAAATSTLSQQHQLYLQQQLMISSSSNTTTNSSSNCNTSNSSGGTSSNITTSGTSTCSNSSDNSNNNFNYNNNINNNLNISNNGYYALIGNNNSSRLQQEQQYQSLINNNNQTLNTILSDPNAFPSLSQFVQSQNNNNNSNQSCQSCMNSNNNNNSILGNSSPHKYSKLQCTEQSILLQRCPNSDYKFIHEFGNDYISNNLIFKKFTNQDLENIFQYFKQGIKLQNKTCKNYAFEQCFDGQEAFSLLQEILISKYSNLLNDISITKLALHLGQFLLTIGKFNHVCKEHCFKNVNLLFYHFNNFNNLQFNELKVTNSPNWYLIYPNIDSFIVQQSNNSVQLFQCNVPIREQFSPIFNSISILELKEILLLEVLPYEEGVEMLCRNDDIYLYTFLQKTKFQEYPDYISIQLLSVQSAIQKSTIAIYSRCKYGYSDWGNNKERVNSWISKIISKCQTHVISRKCSI